MKEINVDHDFIDDCLWMSYRYCIGRHTIAANAHAKDMVTFLRFNPDMVSGERKLFMASDIRDEIDDNIRMFGNVVIKDRSKQFTALELILFKLAEEGLKYTGSEKFDVNRTEHTVDIHGGGDPVNKISISDFIPWINVANWLDPQYEITYECNGKSETKPALPRFQVNNNGAVHVNWNTVEDFETRPYVYAYIAPEYIKSVRRSDGVYMVKK